MMKQLYKAYGFSVYVAYAEKVRVIYDARKCC